MNIQTLSPQGYNINDNPMNHNPFWTQGTYTAKIWINVDDSPIEPGFGFILKSVFNSNNVRVTSHYGYVEATLNTAEAYDLQPVNNSLYMFAQHDLIYSADAGTVEFTINLITAEQPAPTYTFISSEIENGATYNHLYFVTPRAFSIIGVTESDAVTTEYTGISAILDNITYDSATLTYSATLFALNPGNDTNTLKIKVNDDDICTVTITGSTPQ